MTIRRGSLFLFLLLAIARTRTWFDVGPVPFAWALVVNRPGSCPRIDGNYNVKKNVRGNLPCLYSSLASPQRGNVGGSIDEDRYGDKNDDFYYNYKEYEQSSEAKLQGEQEKLSQLYNVLQAEPRNLLRFENDETNELRGLYLNRSVKSGEIVLKLPVDSCLRDDHSPSWLHDEVKDDRYRWATRLAASWADLHLQNKLVAATADHDGDGDGDDDHNDSVPKNSNAQSLDTKKEAHEIWSSLLPDPEYLSASLPVHWPKEVVVSARSTALELAVDSAFFARAEAVEDLVRGLEQSPHADLFSNHHKSQDDVTTASMYELAHRALDLVQTRSCRLENASAGGGDQGCRRVVAPVFDFINHGSSNAGDANAIFALETHNNERTEEYLVVRSLTDISKGQEVKIDYGDCARPAWKCLLSYGFVPEYKRTTNGADSEENLAEVYMKGVRYEVADDSVPADMVVDASPQEWVEMGDYYDGIETRGDAAKPPIIVLTPDIALRISERIADAACYLLLEPADDDDYDYDDEDIPGTAPPSLSDVISARLAAKLRWFQHKVLLTCAAGLAQFAKEQESTFQ
eukprot:CAMPEP_0172388376 /NCGR_PEP_ID=MMETSP1061-20121228/5494_1 /TAXON_ID=37318 /ORGANISM="Pseudo-nitzschia pungens, Strain cf. pungens" /LENGTH=572 /DNA_ID=CAMNT_0013118255 /DNA_START=59 /DNA_END=1777 /DNA_ORIENTATION=+